MSFVPLIVWSIAGVLAVLVLGWCAVSVLSRSRRLRVELAGLQSSRAALRELRDELSVTEQRIVAAQNARKA